MAELQNSEREPLYCPKCEAEVLGPSGVWGLRGGDLP